MRLISLPGVPHAGTPPPRPARLAMLLAGASLSLAACTTAPPDAAGPSMARHPVTEMGMRDLRAEFRRAFCARLPRQADCADILLRLPGEPVHAASSRFDAPATLAGRYRLAFVPGLLAGCAGPLAMPFADTVDTLRAAGFDARILSIDGRGSTPHNAALIARQLTEAEPDPRPWIVFGYSKGLPDALEALVQHPQASRDIAAVVSYAGAVGGSRLADEAGGLQAALLEHVPLPGCDAGDGTALQALRRDVRHAWWQAHHTALRPPIYALAAAARPDRVSAPLRGTYATLSKTDPLNDGQLIAADALAPGGTLLGYVNADHWAMAMQLSRLPIAGALFIDDVPRADLVLAAVQVISQHTPKTHEKARLH
ncbi:MAG: hypothetical protein JSR16_09260 [Proteobacteria bacterium]|nr:hypothetical protein [Pseudomonadota bacterium]MBS0302340.1 hypothetical protein [Pseudomonadota bacterium]